MSNLLIRLATADDLAEINAIYNHYVLHATSTYQTEPETPEARAAWFAAHTDRYPVTVAHLPDNAIVGWGSLSRFHPRAAYGRTVENSVYVHPGYHRQGVGRALLADLIQRARQFDYHTIIAGIDAEQTASLALHERLSFERVAHLRQVGFKFNHWLDVIYMQLML
jgi:L-amino acid N-acyltransferase YncA